MTTKDEKQLPQKKINRELWKRLKEKITGNAKDKVEAIRIIKKRYYELPEEVDRILKELAHKEQPKSVRYEIAKTIAGGNHILPIGLHFELVEILKDDPDKKIRTLMQKEEERWKKFSSVFTDLLQATYSTQISSLTFLRLSDAIRSYKEFINNLSSYRLSFEAYEPLLKFTNDINRMVSALFISYYSSHKLADITIPKVKKKSKADELIKKLQSCPKGEAGWQQYQEICGEILKYLFAEKLGDPLPQQGTESGLYIRDYIIHIPYTAKGFWSFCRLKFNSIGIIVECKNHSDGLKPNDIVVTSKYLSKRGLGNFGIILNRIAPSKQVIKQILEIWKKDGKLVIVLSDQDVINMVKLKANNDDPEKILDKKIFELLKLIE